MTGLPDGVVLRLRADVRASDGGRALVGGAPTRVLYLKDAARGLVANRRLDVRDAPSRALADILLDAGLADPVLETLPTSAVGTEDVTFVIPAYGRADGLDRLLASVPPGHPLIVVDDASPDPEPIAATAARHGAKLVVLERNLGPAGARNGGLEQVTTPFVVFVDTDVVIDDGVVPTLLRHFADERMAVVAPRVLGLRDGAGANWIERYEAARSSLDLGPTGAAVKPRAPVSWVPATFLLARVEALGAGFTPGMREGEDVDLVWRLVADGLRVRYEPGVVVRHEHRATTREWLSRKVLYGSSATPLERRHGNLIAPAVFAPWSLAFMLALLAQRKWSPWAVLAIAGWATVRIARKLTRSDHPYRDASRLTLSGIDAAVKQTMALLVRHWWPVAVLAAFVSRRARRALLVSAALDAALEYRRTRPRLDFGRFALARRLDDLAYGFGVWKSAFTGRSLRALLPDIVRGRRRPRGEEQADPRRGLATGT
ncbi:mycofactocin biosynthesis glycosyltransferase MftF [Leifsonia shinshuensis]|uniref:mycofactocin biosynthesis glycosyltransferase MftF n=1 Tax=Leifsonia shinshuensis TaxID=150026 RepID=UPI001F506299|nr:mycofactocin biosynthesis glycosyltransferase MftF [Leifsonia shinshuensis]MCI0158871.1 mycofactocin biosynthesis glycosyltransferase MftF [Leifsonia shinshuensis]